MKFIIEIQWDNRTLNSNKKFCAVGLAFQPPMAKGSLKNKSAILSVEVPVWQGAKTQEYQDISTLLCLARQAPQHLKLRIYFAPAPKVRRKTMTFCSCII